MEDIIVVIIIWVIGIVLNGMIASEKNRGITEVVICSIFFSPFLVYLYLLAVPAKEKYKKIVYVRDNANYKPNTNNTAASVLN